LSWYRVDKGSGALLLAIQVQPNARRSEVAGMHGDALKIRLAAPAIDGRANECLLAFVAGRLKVKRAQVSLLQGDKARRKLIGVEGSASAVDLYQD
jgi:uncharacterized protein